MYFKRPHGQRRENFQMKMKKLVMIATVACATLVSQAAIVSWGATATSAYNGQTMYLLTSIADSYASEAALAAAAVDSAKVVKSGPKYIVSTHVAVNEGITKTSNFYLAVLDATDGKTLHYLDVTDTFKSYVYAPPENSPGNYSTAFATVANSTTTKTIGGGSGGGEGVPEPTSGLLLLVGGAMLALRRKQK